MAGDERTGACVMRVTEGLDSGPVARREETEIGPDEDYGSLAARLAEIGARILLDALDGEAAGTLELTEQPDEGVTYAEKVGREERRLDPRHPALDEARRVRALTPHVGAFAELADGGRLGLRDARADPSAGPGPGEFVPGADGALVIGCDPGALRVATVQPAGGRWMAAEDYLRGNPGPAAIASPT